jgi:hypothetical protein
VSAALTSKTDATDSFFRAFKQDTRVDAGDYAVVAFGDSEAMADELLEPATTAKVAIGCPVPVTTPWSSTGAGSRGACVEQPRSK